MVAITNDRYTGFHAGSWLHFLIVFRDAGSQFSEEVWGGDGYVGGTRCGEITPTTRLQTLIREGDEPRLELRANTTANRVPYASVDYTEPPSVWQIGLATIPMMTPIYRSE
ncbi:hypothetical protein Tco_0091114 [Tanacetum coccineum]